MSWLYVVLNTVAASGTAEAEATTWSLPLSVRVVLVIEPLATTGVTSMLAAFVRTAVLVAQAPVATERAILPSPPVSAADRVQLGSVDTVAMVPSVDETLAPGVKMLPKTAATGTLRAIESVATPVTV